MTIYIVIYKVKISHGDGQLYETHRKAQLMHTIVRSNNRLTDRSRDNGVSWTGQLKRIMWQVHPE